MSRIMKRGFADMKYDQFMSLQISEDGKRVLKICSSLPGELLTLQLFERLAPQYAPSNPHFVTLRGKAALEMDFAGECIADVMYNLSESEFALCMLQSVEMLLLIGNALSIGDFHPGNVCFEHRGQAIQIRFIDTEHWIRAPATGRQSPDAILEQNSRIVLFGFWENIIGPSKNMRVHELKYKNIVRDRPRGVVSRLCSFADSLHAFVAENDPSCAPRAQDIHARITELCEIYVNFAERRAESVRNSVNKSVFFSQKSPEEL
jgi:hypothetical protein